MQEHLPKEVIERFHLQNLRREDRRTIYDHVLSCELCSRRTVAARRDAAALISLCPDLLPNTEGDAYHLDFEMIEGYVGETLAQIDSDTAQMHLEVCTSCLDEVRDLRGSLATMENSHMSAAALTQMASFSGYGSSRLRPLLWRPVAASVIAAIGLLMIATVFVLWQLKQERSQELVLQPDIAPIPLPNQSAAKLATSSANAGVGESITTPLPQIQSDKSLNNQNGEVLAVLNDGPRKIFVAPSGQLRGVPDVSDEDRETIRTVLLSGNIKRPAILNDLDSVETARRSDADNETSVTALAPFNTVIVEDKPLFRWVPLKGAVGYRVLVGDYRFRQAAASGDLPATATTWQPATPLIRGEIYSWVVIPIRDGNAAEFTDSTADLKFKVLEEEKAKELDRLKKSARSNLVLGIVSAREGMTTDAEHHLRILAEQNPDSTLVRKLLKQVQTWVTRRTLSPSRRPQRLHGNRVATPPFSQ